MKIKTRKLILAAIIAYIILILYLLFLGFNRLENLTSGYGYVFMLIPSEVPLNFPRISFSWLYNFGNIAAFIPFGVIFPLLYRVRFGRFITRFILVILIMETIQSLTHLGTFDIDDVISNTLGATIGYVIYKVGFSSTVTVKKLMASTLSAIVLLIGIITISEVIELALEKKEGPIQALNNWKEQDGKTPMTENLPSFNVANETITPKMNLYKSENGESTSYTYNLSNKKDVIFYATFGITHNEEFKGELIIIKDGEILVQYDEIYNQSVESVIMPLGTVNEITIIVSDNAKLWDVGLSEKKHWWQ